MVVASPMETPALSCNGQLSGAAALILRAASSNSSQDFGCQLSASSPADLKRSLRTKIMRASVPSAMP
ncbi:hypothetical protein D3C72_2088510 [compost metagenome]